MQKLLPFFHWRVMMNSGLKSPYTERLRSRYCGFFVSVATVLRLGGNTEMQCFLSNGRGCSEYNTFGKSARAILYAF